MTTFTLLSERETQDDVVVATHTGTFEEAQEAFADIIESDDWPEGTEAVMRHEGRHYLYTSEWEDITEFM